MNEKQYIRWKILPWKTTRKPLDLDNHMHFQRSALPQRWDWFAAERLCSRQKREGFSVKLSLPLTSTRLIKTRNWIYTSHTHKLLIVKISPMIHARCKRDQNTSNPKHCNSYSDVLRQTQCVQNRKFQGLRKIIIFSFSGNKLKKK